MVIKNKKIYMPKYVYDEIPVGNLGIELILVDLPGYTKLGDWKFAQEQLELMLNYK